MAHPYKQHSEHRAGRNKAKTMLSDYKRGGAAKHSDEAQDKALFNKMFKEKASDTKASGDKGSERLDKFARGGKAKGKGKSKKNGTNINIIVAPKGGDAAQVPDMGAPKDAPMPPPPPGPMAGPPLGAGPPGMPPGMPPGGPPGMMNKGGRVKGQKGGDNGVGRLDKAKMVKRGK